MSFTQRLKDAISNNTLISWIEPDEDIGCLIWFASARDCVLLSKEYAEGRYDYPDDTDALYEFIVVHWADIEDNIESWTANEEIQTDVLDDKPNTSSSDRALD